MTGKPIRSNRMPHLNLAHAGAFKTALVEVYSGDVAVQLT